jgi:hypothetical protein
VTPATAVLLEMLDHIDKLKALHRANESPSFGQVEDLFDRAAGLRLLMSAREATRPAGWPRAQSGYNAPKPVEKAARHLVELVMASLTEPGGGQ